MPVQIDGSVQIDTELVFLQAGRNIGMGARIDIGIDSNGNRRDLSECGCHPVYAVKFRGRLDVEAENPV